VGSAGDALAFVKAARANGDNLAPLRLLFRGLGMKRRAASVPCPRAIELQRGSSATDLDGDA